MAKLTPTIGSSGRYALRLPWIANPDIVYECEAIRSFDDIYKLGIDVYKEYYLSAGLVEGNTYGGSVFTFAAEKALDPNIITLRGTNGSYLYVPDTYMEGFPDVSGEPYSRVVVSIDLGAIPDFVDLSTLMSKVANVAQLTIGAIPQVSLHKAPATEQPTKSQHITLEAARTAGISITQTDYQLYMAEVDKNDLNTDTIAALVARLQELGDMPPP